MCFDVQFLKRVVAVCHGQIERIGRRKSPHLHPPANLPDPPQAQSDSADFVDQNASSLLARGPSARFIVSRV